MYYKHAIVMEIIDITSVASDTSALRPIVPRKSKSLKLNDGRHVVGKTLLNRRSVGCFGFVFTLGDPPSHHRFQY